MVCGMHGKEEKRTLKFEWRNIKQRDHVKKPTITGAYNIKRDIKRNEMKRTAFMWARREIRVGSRVGNRLLWTRYCPL